MRSHAPWTLAVAGAFLALVTEAWAGSPVFCRMCGGTPNCSHTQHKKKKVDKDAAPGAVPLAELRNGQKGPHLCAQCLARAYPNTSVVMPVVPATPPAMAVVCTDSGV